jgi:hypothetical protein
MICQAKYYIPEREVCQAEFREVCALNGGAQRVSTGHPGTQREASNLKLIRQ